MDTREDHQQIVVSDTLPSRWDRIRWSVTTELQHLRVRFKNLAELFEPLGHRLKSQRQQLADQISSVKHFAGKEVQHASATVVWWLAPKPTIKWRHRVAWLRDNTLSFIDKRRHDVSIAAIAGREKSSRICRETRMFARLFSKKCDECHKTLEPYGFVGARASLLQPFCCDDCGTIYRRVNVSLPSRKNVRNELSRRFEFAKRLPDRGIVNRRVLQLDVKREQFRSWLKSYATRTCSFCTDELESLPYRRTNKALALVLHRPFICPHCCVISAGPVFRIIKPSEQINEQAEEVIDTHSATPVVKLDIRHQIKPNIRRAKTRRPGQRLYSQVPSVRTRDKWSARNRLDSRREFSRKHAVRMSR